MVVTADGGWRRGSVVPLKANTDAALEKASGVRTCLVVRRVGDAASITMQEGRDVWWHEATEESQPPGADHLRPRAP